jgi:pyruvate/2-oxoglutarate/acetoin dehydrogenase E1 component
MKVVENLNRALHDCFHSDDRVHFLGEDILDPYGGAFKLAKGLSRQFPDRIHTTPVSEAGIVGVGVGMALRGLLPIVEIMFGDFITLAADQLINHAAKLRWMSNDRVSVPLVVRTPMGGRRGYGPTHSQTLERLYLGVPGLRVVAVHSLSDPADTLKRAVLEDSDPVLLVEHKVLYGLEVREPSSLDDFNVKSDRRPYPCLTVSLDGARETHCTMTCYGHMAELALEAMRRLAYEREIFCELVVFSQLSPFDLQTLLRSLKRSNRLVTLEEGVTSHGWGAEIVARALEMHEGPLLGRRIAARDLPVPASAPLEHAVLPSVDDIIQTVASTVRKD